MHRAPEPPFLLFAASEHDPSVEGLDAVAGMGARLLSIGAASWRARSAATPNAPTENFPGEQGRSVRLALDIGESLGRAVRVIDLSHPGDDQELATRYARGEPLLPLLVAPSGRRLEGLDSFVPAQLKRFFQTG